MALTIGGKRRKPGGGPPATPMTPMEERLVRRLVAVMGVLAENMNVEAYARAISALDPDLLERLLNDVNIGQISRLLDDSLRGVVLNGGTAQAKEIIRTTPRIGQNPFAVLEFGGRVLPSGIILPSPAVPAPPDMEFVIERPVDRMFRYISDRATAYAQTRSGQLVTAIDQSNRLAIRQMITQAVTGQRTVDQTARALRQIVGLHPRWARAVERFNDTNFRRLVKEGFSTDKAVEMADSMTEKYRRKLIRRRAEMIARTEVQQAQNFGREASWAATERAGLVDARAMKEWVTAPAGSRYGPPCEICTDLRGSRVPWNGSFANGRSMPPAHPNCRCTAVLVPPTRGLTGLPSQDMQSWIDELDRLEAEEVSKSIVIKHLPGRHDQGAHGRGGNASLTQTQQKMLDAVRATGTSDAARTIHNAATGHWETGSVNDALGLSTVRQKDVEAVSRAIAAEAQQSLRDRGFGETINVWRTGAPAAGEVVSVTTREGGLRGFRGEVRGFRVRRSDVLTDATAFIGRGTFAEDELHVLTDNLQTVGG